MATNLSSIISLCAQRKKQQLFNIPPSRIEIVSPYENTNITKFQLDMRRKAEVLKHDKSNTKHNNLTKKQKFAQVIIGSAPPIPNKYIRNITEPNLLPTPVLCNNTDLPITTTSSASGVPNDYISGVNILYSDPTIPLYNFINPVSTRSYGFLNNPLDSTVIRYSNYTNTDSSNSLISTVEFTDLTTNPYYTLNFIKIPLAFQIYGDISNNVTILSDSIQIVIPGFLLNVYYNDQYVIPNSNYIYSFTPVNNYTVDVSINSYVSNFSGTFFIGYLNISNISLIATPGYMYDFKIIPTINYNNNPPNAVNNITNSIILNVTNDYLLQHLPYNCKLSFSSTVPTITDLGKFSINVTDT